MPLYGLEAFLGSVIKARFLAFLFGIHRLNRRQRSFNLLKESVVSVRDSMAQLSLYLWR